MTNGHPRRRFLEIAGTGAAASLAGCSQLGALTQSDDESSDAVTVAVTPDQEELQRLDEEIRTAVENGDLSQREAQQRSLEERRNLTEEAATEFEESAAGSDITVEESEPQFGLLLVTGPDEAIMSALRGGDISGIYPGDQYDTFVQQQQQRVQRQEMLREQQEQREQRDDGAANESVAGNESDESVAGNETNESDSGNGTNESDTENETDE